MRDRKRKTSIHLFIPQRQQQSRLNQPKARICIQVPHVAAGTLRSEPSSTVRHGTLARSRMGSEVIGTQSGIYMECQPCRQQLNHLHNSISCRSYSHTLEFTSSDFTSFFYLSSLIFVNMLETLHFLCTLR